MHTLADFDWDFNAKAINRTQIEELATAAFIGRKDNLVLVGQSGVGKSRIVKSIGQAACVAGHRVRYTTSADLLVDLTARLADRTLPRRIRYYARFDWLIIDEFAFDKIERSESPQASNLLYKIIDARSQRSTTVVTNVDFDAWVQIPGRSVAGDGLPGPGGRRCHHPEDQRQVLPCPPGRHQKDDCNQLTKACASQRTSFALRLQKPIGWQPP